MNKNLETKTSELLEAGVKELVVREGKAADLFNPRNVSISGVLKAPQQYLNSTKLDNYVAQKSHILISSDNRSITLNLHETEHFMHTVHGQLVEFEDLSDLGINESKFYTHRDLVQLLKRIKFYFAKVDEHAVFLSNMENFRAKVSKEIEDIRNNNGNRDSKIHIVVENAMKSAPKFTLNIPVYKGYPKVTFEVEVCIDANDAGVKFYFESQDLFQLEKELAEQYIGEELDALHNLFPCSQVFTS